MRILLTIIIALALLFAVSFLLDIPFITDNWLRYAVVVMLALFIVVISAKMVWQGLKDLKDKLNP